MSFNKSLSVEFSEEKLAELKSYLRFTEGDSQRIQEAATRLSPSADAVAESLDSHLLNYPELKALLGDKIETLKLSQAGYFERFLGGEVDQSYCDSRVSVGRAQGRIGLLPSWYMGAFWQYASSLSELLRERAAETEDFEGAWDQLMSVLKLVFLDMSISTVALVQSLFGHTAGQDEGRENAEAVSKVLAAVSEAETYSEAIQVSLDAVRGGFGWAYGSYWVRDEARGDVLAFELESGTVSEEFRDVTQSATFAEGIGVAGRTWEGGELLFVGDLGIVEDCVRAPVAFKAGVKSGICFPIKVGGEVRGTMDFFAMETLSLSDERRAALENVARLVSSAIQRLEQQDRQREDGANTEAVNKILAALGEAEEGEGAVAIALETVREAFGWAYGSYWERDAGRDDALVFQLESGEVSRDFRDVTQSATFAKGVGVAGRTWEGRELLFVGDLGLVDDCVRSPVAAKAGVKSGVCFPIIIKGEVRGTMDFFAMETLQLSKGRREALENVGRLVSGTLERLGDRDQFREALGAFSAELSTVSAQMKETTAEQSAAAQELATSVAQVTTTLAELRQASADALGKAELVIEQAQESVATSAEGSQAVEEAVGSMRSIREQVSEIAERILTLSEQTSQIGDIIASVNEIAAQSKLLALNAAIEAARAGEHGKGFAVVATEIRSLSDQSKDATSQVKDILGEIQGGTNQAVVAAEEGTKKVAVGMDLADRSGQNIHALSKSIERSAESARLIANSARQQSAGIQQVADAMNAIGKASHNTVAGVRQTDDAAQSLVQLSSRMENLIKSFA